jgi:hypothetical protein
MNRRAKNLNLNEFIEFDDNDCPEVGFPGYSRDYKLYFISDPDYSTLTAFIQKTNQTTLQKQSGNLTRSVPTAEMNSIVAKMNALRDHRMEHNSAIAVQDPSINYLDSVAAFKQDSHLESPDGYFWVTPKGIERIKVIRYEKDKNYYLLDSFKVVGFDTYWRKGERGSHATWFPASQQFEVTTLNKVPGLQRCNFWSDLYWTFAYEKIEANVWKEVGRYGKEKRPTSICRIFEFNENTCKRRCAETPTAPKPDSYLVKDLGEAKGIYNKIAKSSKYKPGLQGNSSGSSQQNDGWEEYWDQRIQNSRDSALDF